MYGVNMDKELYDLLERLVEMDLNRFLYEHGNKRLIDALANE